jgi:hypothetical protein
MIRRLFTILSVLSLLLCVAACVLWASSYAALRSWSFGDGRVVYSVGLYRGRWEAHRYVEDDPRFRYERPGVTYKSMPAAEADEFGITVNLLAQLSGDLDFDRWGVRVYHYAQPWTSHRTYLLTAPAWPVVLLSGLMPAASALARLRAVRRKRAGHCPTCGYDLRATPDRCPECGAVPAAKISN